VVEQDPPAKNEESTASETPSAAVNARSPNPQAPKKCEYQRQRKERDWYDCVTLIIAVFGLFGVWYYAYWAKVQAIANGNAANAAASAARAATSQAATAQQQLELSERPWIKIKHRIVGPLTFGVPGWKEPVANAVIEDTVENVGQSVALDVLQWEDIIPLDYESSDKIALARQNQWCDANRHPAGSLPGYILFPHDAFVQNEIVGPTMETVLKAAKASPKGLTGKVSFVMVGCVSYRIPFESPNAPRHETKFMYTLGHPAVDGVQPWIEPHGTHPELRLITFPKGFSAD
jgi:hypothetical protein